MINYFREAKDRMSKFWFIWPLIEWCIGLVYIWKKGPAHVLPLLCELRLGLLWCLRSPLGTYRLICVSFPQKWKPYSYYFSYSRTAHALLCVEIELYLRTLLQHISKCRQGVNVLKLVFPCISPMILFFVSGLYRDAQLRSRGSKCRNIHSWQIMAAEKRIFAFL